MKRKFLIIVIFSSIGFLINAQNGVGPGGNGNGDPCSRPNPPPGCPVIPIDNHIVWLFVLGAGLGGLQLYKSSKKKIKV